MAGLVEIGQLVPFRKTPIVERHIDDNDKVVNAHNMVLAFTVKNKYRYSESLKRKIQRPEEETARLRAESGAHLGRKKARRLEMAEGYEGYLQLPEGLSTKGKILTKSRADLEVEWDS